MDLLVKGDTTEPPLFVNVDYSTGKLSNYWIDSLSASFASLQVSTCQDSLFPLSMFIHPSIHSSIHSFINPSIQASTYLFIHPFIHSFIHSSIHIHLSIYSFIYPKVNDLSIYLHVSICLCYRF